MASEPSNASLQPGPNRIQSQMRAPGHDAQTSLRTLYHRLQRTSAMWTGLNSIENTQSIGSEDGRVHKKL